jgi:hypothetical protein
MRRIVTKSGYSEESRGILVIGFKRTMGKKKDRGVQEGAGVLGVGGKGVGERLEGGLGCFAEVKYFVAMIRMKAHR